ncbi:MAG TPA: MFS transporter [Candidatus Binataceae bacterium]|nr:MFS transporter [Candidatus Binataceae bacterium]
MDPAQRTSEAEAVTAFGGTLAPPGMTVRAILRRYYGIWTIYSFGGGFLYGVYPLFLRSRGLDQFQMNSVLALYFFVTFLTDVPTGAFADALGRRRSFVLGCTLRFAAFLTYFFAHRYAIFLVAESIDGIGTTFCNGAIDAWGVDALDAGGYGLQKDRLFSRVSQLSNFGFMLAAIIGAYLADVDIALPWLLGAVGYVVAGLAGILLMHEARAVTARLDLRGIPRILTGRVIAGLRQGWRNRTVLLLSLANGIFFAAWAPYWLEWPQYFNDAWHVGIWIVGWYFCLFTIARMAGAEIVVRTMVESREGDGQNQSVQLVPSGPSGQSGRALRLTAIATVLSALLFAAGLGSRHLWLVMAAFFSLNICFGAVMPLMQTWFNEQIGAGERATLLSFNSTFSTIGAAIGLLLGGRVADYGGLGAAWMLAGLISIGAAACFWALRTTPAIIRAEIAPTV